MKVFCKKNIAFTLAEVMIVLAIASVIALISIKLVKSVTNSTTKYSYYAAFTNLKQGVGELMADGYVDAGAVRHKALPPIGNTAAGVDGFCNRLSDVYNVPGAISCTRASTTVFTTATVNFTTANGMGFYNLGSDSVVSAPANFFNVYIDINGTKGSGVINQDVMRFLVFTDGTVHPAPDSIAYTDTSFITATVRYANGAGVDIPLYRGVSYQHAMCKAGIITNACTPLSSNGIDNTHCGNNNCYVVINRP